MIAYGVSVRSQERFDDVCLPSIVTHGGSDAALLTVTDSPVSEAYNEILEASAGMADLEALVLLADDTAIDDADFLVKVRRAISGGTDVGGVIGASCGTGLDWWTWTERHGGFRTPRGELRHDRGTTTVDIVDGRCLVLSPRAVRALRFDASNFPGGYGADVDLCWQAADRGFRVDVIELHVVCHGEGLESRGSDQVTAAVRFQAKWADKIASRILANTSESRTP